MWYADGYCKRYNKDLQDFFCGPDWIGGEVDAFFVYMAHWLKYFERAYEVLGQHDLEEPAAEIFDNPEKFKEWSNCMIEAKQNSKRK